MMMEAQCSTSADTVRSIHGLSGSSEAQTAPSASMISSTTTMTATQHLPPKAPLSPLLTISRQEETSLPASPTPSLSDTDSESSFPSISSSFFFSSAAHSPSSNPYSQPHSNDSGGEYEGQEGEGLHMIIPSLALPEPVHPNPRQEVGVGRRDEVRLIAVVGPDMLEEVEQSLVRVSWEEDTEHEERLKILRGTLDGGESESESGNDKRNLRVALWVIEHSEVQDNWEIIQTIGRLIISSFRLLDSQLNLDHKADLLASSTCFSDIYTAVLVCPTSSLTDHIGNLGDLIPFIHLDLPVSQQTLHDLILPTGLSRQKKEVADNFLRWRASGHEREVTVTHVKGHRQRARGWTKANWEREIEEELGVSLYSISSPSPPSSPLTLTPLTAHVPPHTVHRFTPTRRGMLTSHRHSRSPEATILSPRPRSPKSSPSSGRVRPPRKRPLSPPPPLLSRSQPVPPHQSVIVDPLHLPSLAMLGADLFGAMRERVFGRRMQELDLETGTGGGASPVKFLMLGFCVGVGVGVWLGRVVWGTV